MPSENNSTDDLHALKIEDELPLKAVGIENLREANPNAMPPHRYLFPWFARRPTPAARMAVLASILPPSVDNDTLLRLMKIGPEEDVGGGIETYVENRKRTEDGRDGSLNDHYGYPRPYNEMPSAESLNDLQERASALWGGDLPKVLDATAGGGVIPFESLRYGLPTNANEINPVPSLLLKVMLEYAPEVDSLEPDLRKWGEHINRQAQQSIDEYYPSTSPERSPSTYPATYVVQCSACGSDLPLAPKWWIRKESSSEGIAARPQIENGEIEYKVVTLPDDVSTDDFDPSEGPVSRGGDAECLACGVVTEGDEIKEKFRDGKYEYDIFGVKYETEDGSGFRAPTDEDRDALAQAQASIESDLDLLTLLSTPVPQGKETERTHNYGITEWRDMFSPRQFVSHAAYLNAYESIKPEIRDEYDDETADALLTILALVGTKLIQRNSRMNTWDARLGIPANMFKGNNFSFQRLFSEKNMAVGGAGSYEATLDRIVDSYEEIAGYVETTDSAAGVVSGDAASLPFESESHQTVVIDPPYYDSIQYAELSDVFYVWLKEYLSDVHPDLFARNLTNKCDEAVANPSRFSNQEDSRESKSELAKQEYEDKMSDIFSELYRVLEPGGSMTVMFTHKETDAWDTLTMSLINAGFIVTSTHPITSEMPQRADMHDSNSADSTILLTGRKPQNPTPIGERTPSLWSEVEGEFRRVARDKAKNLLESELSLTKTDLIIGAFGPTLRAFTEEYPVVDDADEPIAPEKALEAARTAVTKVLAEQFLNVSDEFDDLHGLTKWYVLAWLVYESDTLPYDDGRQLGVGVGVYVDDIKRSTKIWGKKSGDIQLKNSNERVQNIIKLEDERDVSSRKFPVDPRDEEFDYAIDAIHSALHIYDHKGARYAESWFRDRRLQTDEKFCAALKALMDVLPNSHPDAEIGKNLLSGKTGDLLDIDSAGLFKNSRDDEQGNLDDFDDEERDNEDNK